LFLGLCVVLSSCQQAEELVPVGGRLSALMGEGPPPGYIGRIVGPIDGDIPAQYVGLTNPFTPQDQQALIAGQRVYLSGAGMLSCVFCHGGGGRGDGPRAFSLDFRPADFAAPPMLNVFREHQDYTFWWVSDGVNQTVMPSFKDIMSETERWQVITYAWYLGEQKRESALNRPNLGAP